jgi:segregation and condensation protein A
MATMICARLQNEALVVDVSGFEGPARSAACIWRAPRRSISPGFPSLALVEQYHRLRRQARGSCGWSSPPTISSWPRGWPILKSKLLIPKQPGDDSEEIRRGTGRGAAVPPQAAGGDARRGGAAGQPQPARPRRLRPRHAGNGDRRHQRNEYSASLYDLLTAYAAQRQRQAITNVRIAQSRTVWSLKEARDILMRLVGEMKRLDGARHGS